MKYYIGIDLGGTNVRTLLVDENGESYSEVKGPTECENGPDYVCDKIIKQIEALDTSVCGGLQGVEGNWNWCSRASRYRTWYHDYGK